MEKTCRRVGDQYRQGDKLHIPRIGRLRAFAKSPENPVQLQAYAETEFTMLVKRYMESSFSTEDIFRLQSNYDILTTYANEAAFALAQDIDYWLLGYRNVIKKAGNLITAGGILNRAAILAARLQMDNRRIPQTERMWIISPAQHVSLLTIPEFTSADYVSDQPTVTGMVGRLYGEPVIVNNNLLKNSLTGIDLNQGRGTANNVPTPGVTNGTTISSPWNPASALNGDPNGAGQETLVFADTLTVGSYSALYCTPDWLMLWMPQSIKSESSRLPLYLADAVTNSVFFDAKVYRPECAVVVETTEAG
jgi:hypothetical protein